MFAIIRVGNQQYKVKEGSVISVEKLPHEVGSSAEIADILMIEQDGKTRIGSPFIAGASAMATIMEQKRKKTVLVFKKSRRKNYRRKNGHRQPMTILKIESIKH